MVKIETIDSVFTRIIDEGYAVKCGHTVSEIHSILNGMSQNEKYENISDKLNNAEKKDYVATVERVEELHQLLDGKEDNKMLNGFREELELLESNLFAYERRIVEGYRLDKNPVPDVDRNRFKIDNQNRDRSVAHKLEDNQVTAQDNTSFSSDEVLGMKSYFGSQFRWINGEIYKSWAWNQMGETMRSKFHGENLECMKGIDKAMERSPSLLEDTTLYCASVFDIGLNPGDHAEFKGYRSTSFNQKSAEAFRKDGEEDKYLITILAPKGTKGICGNGHYQYGNMDSSETLSSYGFEHEYLLGRGTGFTVLEKNDDVPRSVVILLDG